MKKLMIVFAAIAASMLLVCGHASAIPITPFSMNTPYGTNINRLGVDLAELDWLPGSGLLVDGNAAGPSFVPGQPLEFLYQLKLGGIIDINSDNVETPTMNGVWGSTPNNYEFTAIGRIWENLTYLPPIGNEYIANGSLAAAPTGLAPNMFEVWADKYDSTQNVADGVTWGTKADITAGTGFNNGVKVMEAVPIFMTSSTKVTDGDINGPDNQDTGVGSTTVVYQVTSFDSAYFTFPWTLTDDPLLVQIQFDGTIGLPPLGVDTVAMWDSTVPDYYHGTDVSPDTPSETRDLLFKIDGNSHFAPIPEPATMLLLGSGLVGLAGFARKRKKKVS